jgi:hypothetical protein
VSASGAAQIASITIMGDGTVLRTCANTTSCSASWQGKNIAQGTHVISAIAVDTAGVKGSTSASIVALK